MNKAVILSLFKLYFKFTRHCSRQRSYALKKEGANVNRDEKDFLMEADGFQKQGFLGILHI